ncbi:hypothetical protein AAFN86_07935 [Roseomonas sp. CAU 1739]|uniref:hypothetical protein n=1 Tax=Roseomonas sp. CAU 1739 TaxID=3140364 RepID=UPI00325AF79B
MSGNLVTVLHSEERSIVAELRASKPFQRLEAIRRLLALYDEQPSVATGLDAPVSAEPDRGSGSVINFAAGPAPSAPPQPVYAPPPIAAPLAQAAQQAGPVASAIPLPGPAPAAQVAAIAEAAVADVVMRSPAPAMSMETESASVVSSVRAALLGIGKA